MYLLLHQSKNVKLISHHSSLSNDNQENLHKLELNLLSNKQVQVKILVQLIHLHFLLPKRELLKMLLLIQGVTTLTQLTPTVTNMQGIKKDHCIEIKVVKEIVSQWNKLSKIPLSLSLKIIMDLTHLRIYSKIQQLLRLQLFKAFQ